MHRQRQSGKVTNRPLWTWDLRSLQFAPLVYCCCAGIPKTWEYEYNSEDNLKEIRHNLAHLSLPAVGEFYEQAYRDCRLVYNQLPSPRPSCRCGSNYGSGAELICSSRDQRRRERWGFIFSSEVLSIPSLDNMNLELISPVL